MPEKMNTYGFTLIEVIAVLLLFAIVSAIVVSRMMSTGAVAVETQAEVLKSHIRYVQMRAMNADADKTAISACDASFGISLSANSYFIFRNCDKTLKVFLPGADTSDVTISSAALSPAADVTFDRWGRPCSDLNGLTPYSEDKVFILGSKTIRITKNTGFVP